MSNLAFIGLGVMGFPMAGHLAEAGHSVTVYNRSYDKTKKWSSFYEGKVAKTPADAADGADFIMCCVGNDDVLREVTIGTNGAFSKNASQAFSSYLKPQMEIDFNWINFLSGTS